MINYNYFKFLFLYDKNNFKSIIRTFIAVVILISFEIYLLSSLKSNLDFLNNNYFKLFIILPCILNINIYWVSFKKSKLYQMLGLIPIQLKEFLTTTNLYIFISNTIPRLIYIIVLPVYGYIFSDFSFINCLIKIFLFSLVLLTTQKICILLYESKNNIIKILSLILLISTIFMNDLLSIFILFFINIIFIFTFANSNIFLHHKNKKNHIRFKNYNLILLEFLNFISDKSNLISYISMSMFLFLITYNFNSIEQFNFHIIYFLLILIISSISPLNLLFSSNKEERSTIIYLPITEYNLFKIKFLFSTIMSQVLLFLCIIYNTIIFGNLLTIEYINLPLVLLVCNFIRLKLDFYFPILDWENKSDLWKNYKKNYSLILIIPYIFIGISISIIPLIFVTIFILYIINFILKKFKVEANYFVLKTK